MREWEFKCPKCGKYQPYKWSNIEWDRNYRDGGGRMDFAKVRSSVRLVCEFCKHEIADSDANRKLLNSSAKFVPQNPNAPTTKAGFHWNSLASMSWGELAEMYLRAKESCRRGDMEDAGLIEPSGTTQTGKAGAYTAMSQEQGTKLEGLWTTSAMHLSSMDGTLTEVSAQMGAAADCLRQIEANTGSSAKHLGEIKEDIKKIVRDGLKVK